MSNQDTFDTFRLLANRIMVEEIDEEDNGIAIVEAVQHQDARGRVVAVSRFCDAGDESMGDALGRIAYFSRGLGEELMRNGKKYRVLYVSRGPESEVLAFE